MFVLREAFAPSCSVRYLVLWALRIETQRIFSYWRFLKALVALPFHPKSSPHGHWHHTEQAITFSSSLFSGWWPFPPPSPGLSLEREDTRHLLRFTGKGTRPGSLVFPPGYCDRLFLCPGPWLLSRLRTLPVARDSSVSWFVWEPHMQACVWLHHVLNLMGLSAHFLVYNVRLEWASLGSCCEGKVSHHMEGWEQQGT